MINDKLILVGFCALTAFSNIIILTNPNTKIAINRPISFRIFLNFFIVFNLPLILRAYLPLESV